MKRKNKTTTARKAMKIKKGDMVVAIAGSGAGGKPGKVLQVLPKKQRVIVEGFNQVKKHMRKTQDNPQGGIVEKEASIHVSNLKKVEAETAKTTKKAAAKA